MHKNDINDSKNMWQYHKTSMDHSKIIDTFETYQTALAGTSSTVLLAAGTVLVLVRTSSTVRVLAGGTATAGESALTRRTVQTGVMEQVRRRRSSTASAGGGDRAWRRTRELGG